MLNQVIRRLAKEEPDALRRVLDAEIGSWLKELYTNDGLETPMVPAGGCLIAHAAGFAGEMYDSRVHDPIIDEFKDRYEPAVPMESQFDFLCDRFGIPRAVRAIKISALNALEAEGHIEATSTRPAPETIEVGA